MNAINEVRPVIFKSIANSRPTVYRMTKLGDKECVVTDD